MGAWSQTHPAVCKLNPCIYYYQQVCRHHHNQQQLSHPADCARKHKVCHFMLVCSMFLCNAICTHAWTLILLDQHLRPLACPDLLALAIVTLDMTRRLDYSGIDTRCDAVICASGFSSLQINAATTHEAALINVQLAYAYSLFGLPCVQHLCMALTAPLLDFISTGTIREQVCHMFCAACAGFVK